MATGLVQDKHSVPLIAGRVAPPFQGQGGGAPGLRAFAICHLDQVSRSETRERDLDQVQKARSFRALVISSRRFRTSQLIHDLYDLFRG